MGLRMVRLRWLQRNDFAGTKPRNSNVKAERDACLLVSPAMAWYVRGFKKWQNCAVGVSSCRGGLLFCRGKHAVPVQEALKLRACATGEVPPFANNAQDGAPATSMKSRRVSENETLRYKDATVTRR